MTASRSYLSRRGEIPLWQRVEYFLDEIVPVAEQAGVRLAAHPDDPPTPTLRHTPRLVHQPHLYQRLLESHHPTC